MNDPNLPMLLASGWTMQPEFLEKTYTFSRYSDALQFVVFVAEQAERLNHHPDLEWSHRTVRLRLHTHDANAMTEKDFELALAIESLEP